MSAKVIKNLGDEKKLSLDILCPKPSTLLVQCLIFACVAVILSLVPCESLPKYAVVSCIP